MLSTSFLFLHSLVKMLKFTSIVGYTSCGPTYIESFLTIFGQCINVLNYKKNICTRKLSRMRLNCMLVQFSSENTDMLY